MKQVFELIVKHWKFYDLAHIERQFRIMGKRIGATMPEWKIKAIVVIAWVIMRFVIVVLALQRTPTQRAFELAKKA